MHMIHLHTISTSYDQNQFDRQLQSRPAMAYCELWSEHTVPNYICALAGLVNLAQLGTCKLYYSSIQRPLCRLNVMHFGTLFVPHRGTGMGLNQGPMDGSTIFHVRIIHLTVIVSYK